MSLEDKNNNYFQTLFHIPNKKDGFSENLNGFESLDVGKTVQRRSQISFNIE